MHAKLFLITVLLVAVYADVSFDGSFGGIFDLNYGKSKPMIEETPPNIKSTENKVEQWNRRCDYFKECVPKYLCSNTGNDIDVRFEFEKPTKCPYMETCCPINKIISGPIITKTKPPTGCGYRNLDGIDLKTKEVLNEALFGEFPWMLAVIREKNDPDEDRKRHFFGLDGCGGSLIHPQVALTAAHCVYGRPASDFKVRAGEWKTNIDIELYPHQDRQVVDMLLHEDYNNRNMSSDVALLFLESPFDLAPNVQTLCLPPIGFQFDSARCYTTGWGSNSEMDSIRNPFINGKHQRILNKVDLPVVPFHVCEDNVRKARLGPTFNLHWSFMCAGGELDKDACYGDGGSPLVCPIEKTTNRYYQAGIVSWGLGCGKENVPGVYANVTMFRGWIDKQFTNRKIDSSYYEYIPM